MDRKFKMFSLLISSSILYLMLSMLDVHLAVYTGNLEKHLVQSLKVEHQSSLQHQRDIVKTSGGGSTIPEGSEPPELTPPPSEEPFSRESNDLNEAADRTPKTNHILLLSSLGRSGSSFLGELLAQQEHSFYLFEPELYLHRWTRVGVNTNTSINIIRNMFGCHFEKSFIDFLQSRSFSNVVKSKKMKSLCEGKHSCLKNPLLGKVCQTESVKLIKVIKMRLAWTTELLMDPNLKLKVIHLIRDPRASINSMAKTHMPGMDPQLSCPSLTGDLQTFPVLQKIFPNKVHSVKYEDLTLFPWETAQRLWSFLSEDDKARIPTMWKKYLEEHTKPPPKTSYYSTKRNSSAETEAWRYEITGSRLLGVENYCGDVIKHLGHTMFGSIQNCRNKSISLFTDPR